MANLLLAACFSMLAGVACEQDPAAIEPGPQINLNEYPAYVRTGLHAVQDPPGEEPGRSQEQEESPAPWTSLPPAPDQGRIIRIHALDLPGMPERSFPQWYSHPGEDFSILICFDLDERRLKGFRSPALHLAHIGEQWTIYLNGHLADRAEGTDHSLTRRDRVIPLDVRWLQEGKNCLMFHIRGDPLNMETGFYYGEPYRIAEYAEIQQDTSELFNLSLITLYLAIGLFHILLFLQKREEKYNLYFGLFSVLMALWLFSRTSVIYSFLPFYGLNLRLELAAVYLLLPVFASFVQGAQGGLHQFFLRTIWVFHGLLLLTLLFPTNLIQDMVVIWRILAIVFLLYFLIIIPLRFWRYVRLFRVRMGTMNAIQKSLLNTVPGNLLIGTVLVILAGILDIVNASQGRGNHGITGYVFLIFVGGSALRIANRLLFLNEMVENLNRRLRYNLSELNKTNTRLSASERRYRHLIDGSRDIILSIDARGIIRLASRATRTELGLGPEELEGQHIESLIQGDPADQFRTLEFFRERFEVFRKEKENLQMKIPVRTRSVSQPAQFQLTLQKMQGERDWEILGRLVPLKEDYLLQFLQKEQLTFSLGNELIAVEELSQRLVRNIPRYVDPSHAGMIRIGLREILINAIEHGNLAITYEEKSRELSGGNYSEFIALRQSDPRFKDRTVTVDYNLDANGVIYRIRDQGPGFDHENLARKLVIPEDGDLPLHGRGIMITRNAFDLVEYNEKGNEVRLLKYFR